MKTASTTAEAEEVATGLATGVVDVVGPGIGVVEVLDGIAEDEEVTRNGVPAMVTVAISTGAAVA